MNISMKSSMLSNPNEALSQNAFSLVPQLFSMNAASGGLKAALKMDGSNGSIRLCWFTRFIQVEMGCKSARACLDNKMQNFVGPWREQQCRPWKWTKGPSVCRQCCNDSPDCAKNIVQQKDGQGPLNPDRWLQSLVSD